MSRPVLPWHSPLVLLPTDEAPVWIRRLPFYDVPVRATFSLNPPSFNLAADVDGAGAGLALAVPALQVHTWKYQHLADVPLAPGSPLVTEGGEQITTEEGQGITLP